MTPFRRLAVLTCALVLATAPAAPAADTAVAAPIELVVDESHAPQKLALVHETIPVAPGPLTLAYPKWVPGEHAPDGPIADVATIALAAGGAPLGWRRDPDEPTLIHTNVPPDVRALDLRFTVLFQSTISDRTLRVDWNSTIFAPRPADVRRLTVAPTVILPDGWHAASALHVRSSDGARTVYAPLSLERLVDSPVIAARFLKVVPLATTWPAELDITADTQAALDRSDDAHAFGLFANLLEQDRALFGFRHFEKLHILITQSSGDPFDGLEHEESPYNGVDADDLSKKEALEKWGGWLLAHEQSHSWCGKYRRPAELVSKPDFQGPERTSLLWVYEGLNEYLGWVLATRSGFNDDAFMRDHLAAAAALYGARRARATTALVDTADESWLIRTPDHPGWSDYRRGQDYYEEGMLYWLEADVIIRRASHGRRSLDDFARAFFGQRDTGPIVVPYTREDVEAALGAIQPYDWHGFFESRIYRPNPAPPAGGIEAAGWRLAFTPKAPAKYFGRPLDGGLDASYSIGLSVAASGRIAEVVPGSPADRAGLAPQMTIVAVDGRAFTADVLTDAIAQPSAGTLTFVVRTFDTIETHSVDYGGGMRFPHLERIPGTTDELAAILAPRKS